MSKFCQRIFTFYLFLNYEAYWYSLWNDNTIFQQILTMLKSKLQNSIQGTRNSYDHCSSESDFNFSKMKDLNVTRICLQYKQDTM